MHPVLLVPLTHPVPHVSLPPKAHGPQVEELDVAIVVPCTHTPLHITVRVAWGKKYGASQCDSMDKYNSCY